MILINANAITSINLALQYRYSSVPLPSLPPNSSNPPSNSTTTAAATYQAGAYDYTLSLSSSPTLGLVCNTAQNDSHPCHSSLYIIFPSFERTVVKSMRKMDWVDVAASAGAYYSFVQFLSWILSGLALGH
jgi:hypothetical protein